MRLLFASAALGCAALICGCGPGNPLGRVPVSGEITLQGQPLTRGTIEFAPQSPTGIQSGASITDGKFRIDREHGLPPGLYTVRVFSPSDSAGDTSGPPGPRGPSAVLDRIPPQFNTASTQVLEVLAGQPATYSLAIP